MVDLTDPDVIQEELQNKILNSGSEGSMLLPRGG